MVTKFNILVLTVTAYECKGEWKECVEKKEDSPLDMSDTPTQNKVPEREREREREREKELERVLEREELETE